MEQLPLTTLIDRFAGDGPRDEAFVRAFTHWLHERRLRIRFPVLDRFRLEDVVVTFQMKKRVSLVITGYPADLPGDVTVRFDESQFPFVDIAVTEEDVSDPYEICTLDYSPAGRRVRVTDEGTEGTLIVAATVNGSEEHRVKMDDGRTVTLAGSRLTWA